MMRRSMVESSHCKLSIRKQCALLEVNRSGVYHCHKGETTFNLTLMRQMDEWILEDPTRCDWHGRSV